MSPVGFLVLLVIAAICGALGQALAGYSTGGCIISLILGFVGAFLGVWLAQQFGLPELFVVNIDGQPFPIVWSVIGAAILAAIAGLISRPRTVY
ncbi:MAG: GlsB/YeaQ/YmgE family stress response membrane protein [Caldilineaceae bacterium]